MDGKEPFYAYSVGRAQQRGYELACVGGAARSPRSSSAAPPNSFDATMRTLPTTWSWTRR